MAEAEAPSRIILDPSFLFTDEAIPWLDDPVARPSLVVSATLSGALDRLELEPFIEPFGIDVETIDIQFLRSLVASIDTFGYSDADLPSDLAWNFLNGLSSDAPTMSLVADEFAFLASQSLGVFLDEHGFTLTRMEEIGITLHRVSRENMLEGLAKIRRRLPPRLLSVTKRISNFPRGLGTKFVVAGGAVGLALIAPVGLPLAIAGAVKAGTAFIVGDP